VSSRIFVALGAVGVCLLSVHVWSGDENPFGGPEAEKTKAVDKPSSPRQPPPVFVVKGVVEKQIKRALTEQTEMEFPETPLKDVVDYLSERHHIEIQFDSPALKECNPPIDPSRTLITRSLKRVSLASGMKMLLDDFNLTCIIKNDALLITSKDRAEVTPLTRMYDVRDLVVGEKDLPSADTLNELCDLIRQTVAPETWAGERANWTPAVRPFNHNSICVLVVAQTFDAHQQIEEFLADLRAHKQKLAKD
jgi:hypothetical protein